MGNVFAQKPLKEIVRENQRMIKKSIRELEKEIKTLESNEKKLIADIKKHAKLNQMVRAVPILMHIDYSQFDVDLGRSQDHGERSGADTELYNSVYRNENTSQRGVSKDAGTCYHPLRFPRTFSVTMYRSRYLTS
jgi:hypothetical protein